MQFNSMQSVRLRKSVSHVKLTKRFFSLHFVFSVSKNDNKHTKNISRVRFSSMLVFHLLLLLRVVSKVKKQKNYSIQLLRVHCGFRFDQFLGFFRQQIENKATISHYLLLLFALPGSKSIHAGFDRLPRYRYDMLFEQTDGQYLPNMDNDILFANS